MPPKDLRSKDDLQETAVNKHILEAAANDRKPKRRNRNRKKEGRNIVREKSVDGKNVQPLTKARKGFDLAKHKKAEKKQNIKELNKRDASHISDNRLRALGINPKKYQNKLIYGIKE